MALFAGYAISLLKKQQWRLVLLTAIALENILNSHSQFIIRDNRQPVLALESTFDKFSDRSELICVNSGQDPTVVYFTHRKGWVATNEQLLHDDFRDALRQHGCRYILVMKKVFGDDVDLPLPVTYVSDDYTIYSL